MRLSNSAKKKFIQKIKGEVFFDELTRRIYAYSASICYLLPAAVIYPLDKEDVINAIIIATEEDIPITARGCGSGVAGQNLGEGVILDFSQHMNRILNFNPQGPRVTVEPGIIRTKLLKKVQPWGFFYPPDPSSSDYATLGGMAANNSGGAHSLLYGTTKKYIRSMKVITSEAEEIVVTRSGSAPERFKSQVKDLLREAAAALEKNKPESFRNSCGYNLFEALNQGEVDWTKIFCGSEGTLGIFTEITLDLAKLPPLRYSVLLSYKDALEAFLEVKDFLDLQPSTVQALAEEFLKLIAAEEPEKYARLPKGTHFFLLVEFDGSDASDLERRAEELIRRSSAFEFRLTKEPSELAWVWEIRRSAATYLARLPGEKPVRWIEDAAIPVDRLVDFVMGLDRLLKKYNTSAALFGHAGQGLLHFSPRLIRMSPRFPRLIEELGREHALFSRELKGVPSGEHGDGLLRTPYLKEIWGEVYPYFERLKKIFDPRFKLNPLSIVSSREYRVRDFLRFYEGYKHKDSGALNQLVDVIEACNGCGKCTDFCPVTRSVGGEVGSSRARINLLREVVAGHLKESFERRDLLEFFNLCLHCKTCVRECGTKVDVAKLLEAYFEERYLHQSAPVEDRLLSKSKRLGQWSQKSGLLSKIVYKSASARMIAGIFGLANLDAITFDPLRHRKIETLAKGEKEKAAIYSGCTGDFFNSAEVKAALLLLEKFGYETELISGCCCGEPAFTRGLKAEGRFQLKESMKRLRKYLSSRIPVIFTSPSCLIPFLEYGELSSTHDEGQDGKSLFYESVDFFYSCLVKMKEDPRREIEGLSGCQPLEEVARKLFQPADLKVAVQIPCHLKVLGKEKSLREFIRLLPVADVRELKTNCCGFGGSRGFEKKWIPHAERIGKALADEIRKAEPDVIVSPCVTCRLQIRRLLDLQTAVPEYEALFQKFSPKGLSRFAEIVVVHPLILASQMVRNEAFKS